MYTCEKRMRGVRRQLSLHGLTAKKQWQQKKNIYYHLKRINTVETNNGNVLTRIIYLLTRNPIRL